MTANLFLENHYPSSSEVMILYALETNGAVQCLG